MFQQWLKSFQLSTDDAESDKPSVERLTALLLIEVARSDTSIDSVELDAIREALTASSIAIDEDEIKEIIAVSIQDANTAVSLHTQIRQINAEFSREQKLALIKQMWVVAFADGNLDKYEEHMIRELSGLLHVSHADYMQAKLKVVDQR